ncbi:NUMOD1 domain-containing DNA-binding protein [Winogradskyella poriferorum]|uniref:NUMOD1 domain-containing DNA-binding protein n=1 Tax=Winogradskyella poriferorum TaxID=307627 RepID=A0ABU7W1K6_9FLAO
MMKNENDKVGNIMIGLIYKVVNKDNGKVYIGASTKALHDRKKDHIQKANRNSKNLFHEAISTYGQDSFMWETIDTATTNDELAEKEVKYISEYAENSELYNSDRGGGFKKTVYQYDLNDGKLVSSYDSLEEAGKVVNATKKQISRACLSVSKKISGFLWSYEYREPFKPELDSRVKSVIQLGNDNVELRRFSSVSEASKITGCNKSSIAKVCRGERNHAGGFKWCYK